MTGASSSSSGERSKFFEDFSYVVRDALRLDPVDDSTFRAACLWTPVAQRSVYGGQLIAHCVEAAYRTVDADAMSIHSLRITFIDRGDSTTADPVEYKVSALRNGQSFCIRLVQAVQGPRTLLWAVASFHRAENSGISHTFATPHFIKMKHHNIVSDTNLREAFERRVSALRVTSPPRAAAPRTSAAAAAHIHYLNLPTSTDDDGLPQFKSAEPRDIWMSLDGPESLELLVKHSGIPLPRLHLIIACWLSDFVVALSSLAPHGLPNPNLRMIASLDHAIYFHEPRQVRVDEPFLYEVRSSWAGNNRGLNHGRMFGPDGRLWMSVAQETVIRMAAGYGSHL